MKFSAGGVLSWAVYFKIDLLKFDAHNVVHALYMHLLHTSKRLFGLPLGLSAPNIRGKGEIVMHGVNDYERMHFYGSLRETRAYHNAVVARVRRPL